MKTVYLVVFICINTAFASTCVYEPPECTPPTTVELEDGTSVYLVQKWVQGPRTNAFTSTPCKRPIQSGFYTCRRPDCTSAPCLHGSTCIETRSSYKCNCAQGSYGLNCQHVPTPILHTSTTSPATAISSLYSTLTTTFSAFITSTSLPYIAATTPDVTTDVPTTNTPVQASTNGDSSSAPPSYQGKQYGFSNAFTAQTFEDAKQDCTAFVPGPASGSGLIELTDAEEKAFITDYVSTTSIPTGSSLWIGCPKHLSEDPEHGFYCYHSDYRYSRKINNDIDIGYWDWDTNEPQKDNRRCSVLNLATQKYRTEYCNSAAAIALCEWTP
eukprot:XP_011672925.1 PREDICTED: uncharacterized protein LOC105442479 [Strongylocentrotus purpuratus]